MKARPVAGLTDEDRILWNQVARSATPLKGKTVPQDPFVPDPLPNPPPDMASPSDVPPPAKPAAGEKVLQGPRTLDRPTRDKLAKGRLQIEARVDLHGMTQGEAHSLLLGFLRKAYAMGIRHVLIITGKGSSMGSDGVLRKAVPAWFATPSFRPLVGSYEAAARHHGGGGALYVRLRRQTEVRER
ncbi:Smr/MutS family protein [Aquibium microcysteis]|uniref:Smr/MutS family protein n=1 Tax=Aquibium microcysteis TaxID=675281 RepID=UPI00165D18FC|nr:Smr/MutS family protein [Aquibium microcysteis]